MNILHMKYALEVARAGSINKASENLLVAQPNVSRAIRELENDLGIQIFKRTAKGMDLTVDGEQFIRYANKISNQISQVEDFYKKGSKRKPRFSISVPKSPYILSAFAGFLQKLPQNDAVDVVYNETSSARAVDNILRQDYQLGIIRFSDQHAEYYQKMLEEKGLRYQPVTKVTHVVLLNKNCPFAAQEAVHLSDLKELCEIVLGDPTMPAMPTNDARKELPGDNAYRQIKVFERISQIELIKTMPHAFAWFSPFPQKWLEEQNLVQRHCIEYPKAYNDILICRKDYQFSDLDTAFLAELEKTTHFDI